LNFNIKKDNSEKLRNLIYNNQDNCLAEVKENFLKIKEEEDFQTIPLGQAEKDSKSKNGQIDFISILCIGLVSVLKVDSQ
jgi:hypothetical protein